MLQLHVNLAAVVVAAILNMVIGSLWYSPMLFAKKWMALIGKSEEELKKGGTGKLYAIAFAGALVLAYVLARLIVMTQHTTLIGGIKIGIWAWLGFVVTSSLGDYVFAGRPRGLFYINNGYHLVTLILMGAVLGVWQ